MFDVTDLTSSKVLVFAGLTIQARRLSTVGESGRIQVWFRRLSNFHKLQSSHAHGGPVFSAQQKLLLRPTQFVVVDMSQTATGNFFGGLK